MLDKLQNEVKASIRKYWKFERYFADGIKDINIEDNSNLEEGRDTLRGPQAIIEKLVAKLQKQLNIRKNTLFG